MQLPINIIMWVAAALPIIVLMVMMVGFKQSTLKAAPVAYSISAIVGLTLFKANFKLVFFESLKGVWSSVSVLLVVFPAILLYEVTREANVFSTLKKGIKRITRNELLQVLIIGWVFASFMQGITGFGVPVAVVAPLLIGLGVKPLYAVIIPLVGHAWANTFGTLGVAWDSLTSITSLSSDVLAYNQAALWATIFLSIFNLIGGLMICWLYGKKQGLKKGFIATLIISIVQAGGQILISQLNTTIAAFIPTTICLFVSVLLGRTKKYRDDWCYEESLCFERKEINKEENNVKISLYQAFIPYICLLIITFVCLIIKPVNNYLGQFKIGFSFPRTETGYAIINEEIEMFSPISIFTHAGLFLIISSFIGYVYFRKINLINKGNSLKIIVAALNKTKSSAIAVILLLMMSKLMSGTGQVEELAQGTAMVFGKIYIIFVPFVGMLGSFITSSNMASNILFSKFQQTTSITLNLNTSIVLGGQTAGAAIGNIISPGNIILGCTTANVVGKEGIILRTILPIALVSSLIIGLIMLLSII